ncbi:hypothetical protein DICPUDRAFT_31378 [Dictyostelium purpureum]|uniref:Fe2OG dioxygenase domain-containing protein n=1 Tax=Dictyostelium purpureum TaxID=5786 RepID=F0ZH67_DICPU|nr:uncharacterized protein DICPUDRAFT_31378 [Dictyostelium purpureum]EGC36718.1 hypothetical protein DICPUDRAFT_31378 [Dictyostelium purpureum]|eukprot:XP_003286743.1 hypothetical protein DICPUDRAFT_31378 [Dictyostelium purpureum]
MENILKENPNKNNNIQIPVIDIKNINNDSFREQLSKEIFDACRTFGFFYIKNYEDCIDQELINRVDELQRKFLSLPLEVKLKWKKSSSRHDTLGYFRLAEQHTNGIYDYKEGSFLHIQKEESRDCSNETSIFPSHEEEEIYGIVGFKENVENYIRAVKKLGLNLISLVSISLGLSENYIESNYMKNPSSMLALLKYPSFDCEPDLDSKDKWGIDNHTDYCFMTILKQDDIGGLQLKTNDGQYIDAPTIPNTFICNPGDLFQLLTGNNYLSMYHRVLYNKSGRDRYSIPLFLAPDWHTPIFPIEGIPKAPERHLENNMDPYKGYSYNKYYKEKIHISFTYDE